MKQRNTKNSNAQNKTGSLIISKVNKAPLSKNQQAFNKLIARIERLRKEIEKKQTQFDTALKIYSYDVHPLRLQMIQQRREILELMWPFFKKRQLSNTDHQYLKVLLQEHLEAVLNAIPGEPDEQLKMMFKDLAGEKYDTAKKREEARMKEQIQEVFEDADMDMEVDFDDENLADKIAEAQQKMREKAAQEAAQYQQNRKSRKKSAKQLEKEKMQQAVDEMKQKNISTIYRQLAKLFHPDLEQDEQRRAEKEVLMKELTVAYEAKNLHALLSLELKWIHKESSHLEALTEDKLAVYLQILNEQAQELESEKHHLFQRPQYNVLLNEFGYLVSGNPLQLVMMEQRSLERKMHIMQEDAAQLKTSNAYKHMKQIIAKRRAEQEELANVDRNNLLRRMQEANSKYGWDD
jgi:hypothetical protein